MIMSSWQTIRTKKYYCYNEATNTYHYYEEPLIAKYNCVLQEILF